MSGGADGDPSFFLRNDGTRERGIVPELKPNFGGRGRIKNTVNADTVTYTVRPHSAAAVPVSVLSMALSVPLLMRIVATSITTQPLASTQQVMRHRWLTSRTPAITPIATTLSQRT